MFPFREKSLPFPSTGREGERGAFTNPSNCHHRGFLGVRGRGDEGLCLLTLSLIPWKRALLVCGFGGLRFFFIFIVNTRYLRNQGGNVIMKGPNVWLSPGGHPAVPTAGRRPPSLWGRDPWARAGWETGREQAAVVLRSAALVPLGGRLISKSGS